MTTIRRRARDLGSLAILRDCSIERNLIHQSTLMINIVIILRNVFDEKHSSSVLLKGNRQKKIIQMIWILAIYIYNLEGLQQIQIALLSVNFRFTE